MRQALASLLLLTTMFLPSCQTPTGASTSQAPQARVIYLEHTKAADMAATLNKFLGEARDAGDEQQVVITPHAGENVLLISGSEPRIAQVMDLIARLDIEKKG